MDCHISPFKGGGLDLKFETGGLCELYMNLRITCGELFSF